MTMCTVPLVAPHSPLRERRPERRVASGKRLAMQRAFPGKIRAVTRRSLDPCDNSNDSGLGFDNHVDHHASVTERLAWTNERAEAKRPRLDIKLEDDEVNDNFSFPETIRTCKDNMSIIRTAPSSTVPTLSIHGTQSSVGSRAVPRCTPLSSRSSSSQPITLTSQLTSTSRESNVSLRIIHQPEQQHRARYQTEGSRGAVKDRTGNGFPVVQLAGYSKPTTLQVFIGTDVGKVAPHMFYQACRVSGKNSTPCSEKKLDGTVVIEMQLDPSKDMTGICDCVGILKERNVDVEHRFPDQIGSRSKKKSTRCRMVFRTTISHDNGMQETLQVCSQPIVCTQPPGIPEICKKSLTSCPASGGLELFILGKNFLKDTTVYFQQGDEQRILWEKAVHPDKEFLQQTHLVCVVPHYDRTDITEPVTVRLVVVSSGKTSEPHQFVYTPTSGAVSSVRVEPPQPTTFMNTKTIWSSVNKHEQGIMPPPGTNQMPLSQRRSSVNISSDIHSPPLHSLKQELIDENSQNSIIDTIDHHRERFRNISECSLDVQQGDSNLAMINESSMDILRRSSVSLDAINQSINENSMNSMTENSMEMMVRRNSVGNHENSMDVPLVNAGIMNGTIVPSTAGLLNGTIVPSTLTTTPTRNELAVMDLRMKMPNAIVSDLANTNAPSMATLHSFGVTEPTNIPLPAQTAQSIENYLSTIETKPVNVDAMSLPNGALHLTQLLNAQSPMAQKICQVMPAQTLLATTTTQSLSHLSSIQSHLGVTGTSFNTTIPTATIQNSVEQALLSQNALISQSTVNAMQSVIEGAILDAKPLGNNMMVSSVEKAHHMVMNGSSTDRNVHSPQDILIGNKSPLLPGSAQDMMLNSPQQQVLMVSPSINTDVNVSAQTPPNIPPDIILNSQISPSMMCRNMTALSQEGLLTTICQPNVVSPEAIIQPQMVMPETDSRTPAHSPVLSNPLTSMIVTTEPEKAILFKATVDLFETQKKISELETLTAANTPNTIEQALMSDIMSTTSVHEPTIQMSNQQANLIVSREVKPDFVVPVINGIKDVAIQIQSEKKNEDRMIPSGIATMSDNELISIINPSCFDQV